MPVATRIYFDLLNNLFTSLLLYKLIRASIKNPLSGKWVVITLIIQLAYSIPAKVPYGTFCSSLLAILCILPFCFPNYKKIFVIFIKFEFIIYIGDFVLLLLHTLLMLDFTLIIDNPYYVTCKDLICMSLLYILYALYTNFKRMKKFHTRYHYVFTAVIVLISFVLSYLTLYICKTETLASPVIPVFFSIIYILIAAFLIIYQKFIDLLDENLQSSIQLEQNKMTAEYSDQIEANLKELHSLRHDIRNHLLTIDGYAGQQKYDKIHDYIQTITDSYTSAPLYDTPSESVSALLNTKHQSAANASIQFEIEWDFPYIHIDDFTIITIWGNLIDNAITAAGKCEQGYIFLSLKQMDSYLEIIIKNNHKEMIHEKNGEFETTKTDRRAFHGIGMKNVRSTVESLNGQIEIQYTNETFEVHSLIPNY